MRVKIGPLLVMFTVLIFSHAEAAVPYCPSGDDSFSADQTLKNCDNGYPVKVENAVHLFDIRKSYNSKNVLVIYTHATGDCKFPETQSPQELIDLYWRMKEGSRASCKKESAVKDRIRSKIKIHKVSEDRQSMTIFLDDIDKVKHDLADRAALVTLKKENNECRASIVFSLSASQKLNLACVYAEPVMIFGFPAPVEEVEALSLFGTDENGKPIQKKYFR